jgi:hypothetical protein
MHITIMVVTIIQVFIHLDFLVFKYLRFKLYLYFCLNLKYIKKWKM